MSEVVDHLVEDLLQWLAVRERTYEETIEAWRTSCPRLPVWEDATDAGLICMDSSAGRQFVQLTSAGVERLHQRERRPPTNTIPTNP